MFGWNKSVADDVANSATPVGYSYALCSRTGRYAVLYFDSSEYSLVGTYADEGMAANYCEQMGAF